MKEIYEIYKKEFKISVIRDTKCLQDEDQLDQVASRSGQNIMSDLYSSNDFALLPFHVDICNEAELQNWPESKSWSSTKNPAHSQEDDDLAMPMVEIKKIYAKRRFIMNNVNQAIKVKQFRHFIESYSDD